METLHQRVESKTEIKEYKRTGFSYYSKTMLKEIENLLFSTTMPVLLSNIRRRSKLIEQKMLPTICIVLRLNEVELLQWYLFVYLFVKEDVLLWQADCAKEGSKPLNNIEFERCDEMIISSAVFAKAISNQSADSLKDHHSKAKFDEDSQRLINNLNLDEEHLNSMFHAVIKL